MPSISSPCPDMVGGLCIIGYFILGTLEGMVWEVQNSREFLEWWSELSLAEQRAVDHRIEQLAKSGIFLGYPYSSGVHSSRHSHMRELRVQYRGRPFRIFYAFDPLRAVILLIGGDKTGDNRFYWRYVPIADLVYDRHLDDLRQRGLIP